MQELAFTRGDLKLGKKKARSSEKYWFATGYYCGMTDNYDPPSRQLHDIAMESIGLDITKEWEDGWETGVHDREIGGYSDN
jgi:hypothetical protein